MSPYDQIREQLSKMVPFARYTGVVIDEITAEKATCHLDQRPEVENHIQSMHAGALFVLGEQASGAAFAGAFLERMMTVRPVAAKADIQYLKIAKGTITATARIRENASGLIGQLDEVGKVQFAVDVSLSDAEGTEVATMTVDWHVKKLS
ncbi:YiiD C-terminal domain-containing protein [Parvularcula lutaonensis]|uniref:YiiD C-terminal domain-containing protein n=1 Tax=Parvularcula lutaonensis TaxID=491923 RepID=A0ABV7ME86_9PROT|nr:YiiD C-terminal domain-containing protein [Parvularcula lutaonensis]GGY52175.1 DUF4442 domain-containing protein [Parvularcula lutaonensis]